MKTAEEIKKKLQSMMDEEIEKLRTRVAKKVQLHIFKQLLNLLQRMIIEFICKTFKCKTDLKNDIIWFTDGNIFAKNRNS